MESHFSKEKFYSIQLLNEPKMAKKMAFWAAGILTAMILFSFLPWTQNINSVGKVTVFNPEYRPQSIPTNISGRIEKWMVMEGDHVKKGDTILMISEVKEKYLDPQTVFRMKEQVTAKEQMLYAGKNKIAAIQSQILALKTGRTVSLNKAKNKLEQTRLKVISDSMDLIAIELEKQTAQIQLERTEKLFQQGLKSLTELEQKRIKYQETTSKAVGQENKLNASRRELMNASIELNSIEADYADKISKAESDLSSSESYYYSSEGDLSKLKNELRSTEIRNTFYAITSPQDGYLVKVIRNGVGENLKEGETIATVLPENKKPAVELYVRPMDIPLLHEGNKVRLQFDAWPALVFSGWPNSSFGTFGGIIQVIDKVDTGGRYRILVTPDPEDEKWPEQVPVGSGVYGWAMLNDVPIWFEIWRQLNGFPPDYMESHETEYKTTHKEK